MSGKVLILSGASSVGKSGIRDLLLEDEDMNLVYSISMTTRPKKNHEIDGKDYIFVQYEEFARAVKERLFIEYTEFDGYYYGTMKQQIDNLIESGKNVLIEVEAQGVGQIKLHIPNSISCFIQPKDIEELEKQIMLRYSDEASARRRISKASVEMSLAPLFENIVENTDPYAAKETIKKLFLKEDA